MGVTTSDIETQEPPAQKAAFEDTNLPTWTIFIYIHAGSDSFSKSKKAISLLEKVETIKNMFSIVIYWDSLPNGAKYGVINQNKFEECVDKHQLNSDDPKTLQDFLEWGFENFKAEHYGLVMWDHGGQWEMGFGGRDRDPNRPTTPATTRRISGMEIFEMQQAIQESLTKHKISKFEFIGFDTCLMGGLEILVFFDKLAEILIANPELDYESGWDYDKTFNNLKNNPSYSMFEFADKENKYWELNHKKEIVDILFRAHSIYDLNEVGDIINGVQLIISKLNSFDFYPIIAQTVCDVVRYNNNENFINSDNVVKDTDIPSLNYIDIGHFISLISIKLKSKNIDLYNLCKELLNNLPKLIIRKTLGQKNNQAEGLSIWMPLSTTKDKLDSYKKIFSSSLYFWIEFLKSWNNFIDTVKIDKPSLKMSTLRLNGDQKPYIVDFTLLDGFVLYTYAAITQKNSAGIKYLSSAFLSFDHEKNYIAQWSGNLVYDDDGDVIPLFFRDVQDGLLWVRAEYQEADNSSIKPILLSIDSKRLKITKVYEQTNSILSAISLPNSGKIYYNYPFVENENENRLPSKYVRSEKPLDLAQYSILEIRFKRKPAKPGNYAIRIVAADWTARQLQPQEVQIQIPPVEKSVT